MPISATSQYALKKLHQQDPAFTKTALTDAASGDALALQALKEKTGLPEVELQEAARLFADHQLDSLFAGISDSRVRNATGSNSPSTFAPGQGGSVNNQIGLRGDAAAQKILGGALKLLVDEKAGYVKERSEHETTKTAKQTELDGLKLNRRERFMGGFFAGVLGGDSDKAEKGKTLRGEIEQLEEKITELSGKISGVDGRMHETTAKHLKQAGDPTLKQHDERTELFKEMLGVVDSLSRKIDNAESAVSSAKWQEEMERQREAREDKDTPHNHSPFDFTNMLSNSSVSSAESALSDVRDEAARAEKELKRLGKSIDIGTIDTTDTGNSWDSFMDMMGNHNSGWFFSGSTGVLMSLSRAEGELSSLDSRVNSIRGGIASQYEAATNDRNAYLDAVAKDALS
jgi:hypothetical protein